MSAYNSSDTFQQSNTTESNGYNLFPAAYMSTKVGGSRKKSLNKENKDKKKGGDCGCSKSMNSLQNQAQLPSFKLFGGRRNKRSMKQKKEKKNKKDKKNKTKKEKW
jgi:hypothetical protein